jgi:GTPase
MAKVPTSTAKEKEKVFLLGMLTEGMDEHELEVQMAELKELVENLPYQIVGRMDAKLKEPHPEFLIGNGKAAEVIAAVKEAGATTLIFNEELSASQQRNWEEEGLFRTVDRQEIILEIFESRAQTREAVLQVQLARMEYSLPRLKRAWTHLERQHGGSTGGRGVGEKQLELDQRMIRARIASLHEELEQVRSRRAVARKSRGRVPLSSVAIVGYTNAGKSTLLNALTGAEVLAANKLFATLDPTTRPLTLPSGLKVLLTDTVGFIRKLPHNLVEAFKATLEEAVIADILIHVVDVSDPEHEAQRKTTLEVLKEIGATDKPTIVVFNKADRLAPDASRKATAGGCFISATTGKGFDELLKLLDKEMEKFTRPVKLLIPHNRYDLVNFLHEAGGVTSQKPIAKGTLIEGRVTDKVLGFIQEKGV